MLASVKSLSKQYGVYIAPFDNFDMVDITDSIKAADKSATFVVPELVKYLSGNRIKSKMYGKIKKFYSEELMYLIENITISKISKFDIEYTENIMVDSCSIYKDIRVIVLKENVYLDNNTSGFDILSYRRGDQYINTIIVQDTEVDTRTVFKICLRLFDILILNNLNNINIPIVKNRFIPLYYDGTDSVQLSKFVIDYLIGLATPFYELFKLTENDISELTYQLATSNFNIISEDLVEEIFTFIADDTDDNYEYIKLITKYNEYIKGNSPFCKED